jgi:hypothetical protein
MQSETNVRKGQEMTTITLPGTIIALVLAAMLALVAAAVIATVGRVLDRDSGGHAREPRISPRRGLPGGA